METFEPGIKSPYVMHLFSEGERGMKCLSCSKVMTIAEWKDRKKCFCKSTDVVAAVACSSVPIRLQTRNTAFT